VLHCACASLCASACVPTYVDDVMPHGSLLVVCEFERTRYEVEHSASLSPVASILVALEGARRYGCRIDLRSLRRGSADTPLQAAIDQRGRIVRVEVEVKRSERGVECVWEEERCCIVDERSDVSVSVEEHFGIDRGAISGERRRSGVSVMKRVAMEPASRETSEPLSKRRERRRRRRGGGRGRGRGRGGGGGRSSERERTEHNSCESSREAEQESECTRQQE
jgi:hypothetical protein